MKEKLNRVAYAYNCSTWKSEAKDCKSDASLSYIESSRLAYNMSPYLEKERKDKKKQVKTNAILLIISLFK